MYKLVVNTISDRSVGGGGNGASWAGNTIWSFYVTVLGAADKLLPNSSILLKILLKLKTHTHTHTIVI